MRGVVAAGNPHTAEAAAALLRSGITSKLVEEHIPFLGSLLKNEQDTTAMQSYKDGGGEMPKQWSDLGSKYNQ